MRNKTKVLLVDDHHIILEGYKNILNNHDKNILLDSATTCKDAYKRIKSAITEFPYDIIFLDISLPPSLELNILSGEDLGLKVKEISPKTKIIIMTMHEENMRIYSIIKSLDPFGFLIKSDVSPSEFVAAYDKVKNGKVYYSQTVNEMLRKNITNDVVLDEVDRKILFNLSRGIKTKDLPGVVNLSLAAIEKRKRTMRENLGIEDGGDLILIDKAKEYGFL